MLVLLLAIVAVGLFFLEKHSIKHIFDGIGYDIKPDRAIAEIGEVFLLETTITNAKRLPVTSLKAREKMPHEIIFADEGCELTASLFGRVLISDIYVMPRRRLTRSLRVSLPRRGCFRFYGAKLTVGSLLGFTVRDKDFPLVREVSLPPKPVKSLGLERLLGKYLGDASVRRFIMEDPILTVGFREYTGREPMRSICWKQTARTGNVTVKNYDHTIDLTVTVILNVQTPALDYAAKLETLYSMARTVCEFLETMETPYRFVTNVSAGEGAEAGPVIPEGLGGGHLAAILELLAKVRYNYFEGFDEMMAKVARAAEHGRSHILLTPEIPQAAAPLLHRLRARTGREALILTPEKWMNSEKESEKESEAAV